MPDATQSTPDSGGQAGGSISQGTKLPYFQPGRGTRPSPFSAEDLNKIVTALNAFLSLRVFVNYAAQPDGTTTAGGQLKVSGEVAQLMLDLSAIAGGSGASSVIPMTVNSVQDDYLTCTSSLAGNPIVFVAKPFLLQRSVYTSLSPFSAPDNAHTYAYVNPQKRTDSTPDPISGTIVADSIIWTPYFSGCEIQAVQPIGGTGLSVGGVPIIYQDSNQDARQWKCVTRICYTNPDTGGQATAYILTDDSPSSTQA